uniref:Uncharacterized protein n=1 Tax=Siphoviridae sp. ctkJH11 TaxID=2825641 RepID=A0A8S5PRW8_9CAUD|nr:MAG TPA: hypothetical protein [Siphoviridae sp. ctkJH11]
MQELYISIITRSSQMPQENLSMESLRCQAL